MVNLKTLGSKVWSKILSDLLFFLTILAVFGGLIVGVIVHKTQNPYSDDLVVVLLKFPGELLIRMLKCVILPLVIASVITGLGTINPRSCGKIGGVAVLYYVITTVSAAVLGLVLVSIIKPGSGGKDNYTSKDLTLNENTNTLDTIMDLLRAAFPSNIVKATFGKDATELTNATREDDSVYLKRKVQFKSGINMIGVIVFSIVVGIIMSLYPKESGPLMKVVQSVNDITMRLVTLILWYSPVGIFFLIAGQFAGVENFGERVSQLGMYSVTVLVGIAIHFFIILPALFFALSRRNPIKYYYNMLPALATAFGTASSSATMPVTFRCVEEKNKIDRRISRFVVPVGATINMDGTALYEAVACLFIAQVEGISMDFAGVVVTALTATLAAIGAAGIPSAGLVTMVMVLNAVNLPVDMISVILTVDWFLDRFRTMTNVMGDALGCAIVQHMCEDELKAMDREKEHMKLEQPENGLVIDNQVDIEMGTATSQRDVTTAT